MSASPAKTLAALRQLATLGLPGKSVVPETIGLLNRLAGFDIWGLRFMDARFRLTDLFASPEVPAGVLSDVVENFHNGEAGGAVGVAASHVMRNGQRVLPASRVLDTRRLEETEYWHRIARPLGVGIPTQMLFHLDGPMPLAMLALCPTLGTREYSAATIRLLEEIQPWLCHLLAKTQADPGLPAEEELTTGDTGVLILGPSGRIESASPGAVCLLLNAVDMAVDAASLRHALGSDAGSLLKRLAQAVGASVSGKSAPLPAGKLRNRYGLFKLRAYALDAFASSGVPRVSVHIERQAPVSQRLFSAPRFLALPNREREVALHLARGRSNVETAAHLDVKPSTVIDATRSLYHRLDIDSRNKLLPALLAADS